MSQPSSFTSATPSLSMTKKEPFSSVKPVVSGRVSALCRPAGEIEMPLDDFMVAWDNVALLMRQRKSSTPPQGRTRCSAWIRPVGTDAPGVYRLYLNGEEHPLPDDFCAQGGILAYSLPDEHPHATTAHRQFSYVEPTQGGILLEHGDTPRKYTVYAIGTDGRMIVGDVTV